MRTNQNQIQNQAQNQTQNRNPETAVNVGRKYKSRKERPCDACRKRKICCTRDAYEKDCSLCRTRGESCKYVLPPNVRRNRVPGANAAVKSRPSTSSSSSTGSVPSRPMQGGNVDVQSRSGNGASGNGQWICQFVGLSGEQDPFVLRHCSFNHANCYKATGGAEWAVLRIKGEGEPLHFTVVPDTHLDARPDYYPRTDTEAIVKPHANDLLRTYFEVIHHSYPLLDPSRFSLPSQTDDPLLAAIYTLAAPFCPSSPPDFPAVTAFIHQALPIETRHPRLETLEATLLFLQLPSTLPTLPAHHSTLGSLVGIAHDLGLNNDPSTWSLSPSDTNRRIRIWWALYIQDKWSALGLGRPSYLNDEHCNVPFPTIANFNHVGFHGKEMELTSALGFIAMAHLSSIVSDLLSTFYTLKAVERIKLLPHPVLFSLLDEFQDRLRVFRDEHLCQLCNANPGTGLDDGGSAILAFYTAEIVLLRAVLRYLPMGHPGYSGVRAQARTTLLNVVEFLEKMRLNRLRAFWWNPMTRTNFSLAGTFMFFQLLTSHTTHDIEFWSATIAHYRSLLRLHAATSELTKLACRRMDLLALGMGVDSPLLEEGGEAGMGERGGILGCAGMGGELGVGIGIGVGGGGEGEVMKRVVMEARAADEWIARQGGEELLLR